MGIRRYASFLEPWLSAYPSGQLLVLRLDDYERAPKEHLRAVLAFLGLTRPLQRTWRRMLERPRANRRTGGVEPMLEATRRLLRGFYAEHNEQLAALLGDASYLDWNEDEPNGTASARAPLRALPPKLEGRELR